MKNRISHEQGFTLAELLIAMVVSGIVVAGASAVFSSMVRSHNTQVKSTSMQQNLRAAMYYLERHIRMAGYDPTEQAGAGFTKILSNEIGFTLDKGDLSDALVSNDNVPNSKIDANWDENVAFRLSGTRLERANGAGAWQLVANNIDALNFVYLDNQGNITNSPSDVCSVQVTIIGRAGAQAGFTTSSTDSATYLNLQGAVVLAPPNDNIRRIAMASNISCRNLDW